MLSKSREKSVLFVGLQIANAENLAIEGGENHEDFHVTLAYGHFDQGGNDEDAVDVMVQSAIKDIRDLIPDKIHFDAIKRFEASESSDGKDVIYAQVAAGQLEKAHDGLLKALKKNGIKLEDTFPVYRPHMTLAYIDPDEEHELREIEASGDAVKVMIGHGHESSQENNYTIMKTDDDKRLVFGWASVSITVDGEQLEDRQKDMIDPDDLEEAVYDYVLNFRDTGEEHIPTMRKKGKLVESCVFTAEKQRAMGIPEGILPVGWWIGFKIEDDAAWERVKNGTYKMFSIEGRANREPVTKSATAQTFDEILKFNPYHDAQGRFASANGATSFTYKPGKSTEHSKAIENEKARTAEQNAGKGFKGTLYHGSPATDIKEFDMSRAGQNTSSGEKLLFFTDSKQMAEDFSYERLEGSTKFLQRRGKKGRVYEVDVEIKNPLDLRNLSDKDIDNILKLDMDGLLTKDMVQSLSGNHQLLKTSLDLRAESLKNLGYDGFIANTGKAGHNSLEYAVVDSKQAKIIS